MLDFSVRLSEQFDSDMVGNGRSSSPEDSFLAWGLLIKIRMCGSRGETGGLDPTPLKRHEKCRVSLQYWSGSPASSARQQNAISMAFRWRADDGPFISVTKLSRSAHGACFLIILNQRTCRATECVECEITHMSKKRTQS